MEFQPREAVRSICYTHAVAQGLMSLPKILAKKLKILFAFRISGKDSLFKIIIIKNTSHSPQ